MLVMRGSLATFVALAVVLVGLLASVQAVPADAFLESEEVRLDRRQQSTRSTPNAVTTQYAYYSPVGVTALVGSLLGKRLLGGILGNVVSGDLAGGLLQPLLGGKSKMMQYSESANLFKAPGATASTPVVKIDLSKPFQPYDGAGVALTDASVILMRQMKQDNADSYKTWISTIFHRLVGMNIVRIPIGATDFSADIYTLADKQPTADPIKDPIGAVASSFDFSKTAGLTLPIVQDIQSVRGPLKVMLSPWSPPAWMKVNGAKNLNGFNGGLKAGYNAAYAEYLAQAVKAWTSAGVPIWSLTLQNEPSAALGYPSMLMNSTQQAQVATILKQRLAALGLGSTKIFYHDDNFASWESARDAVLAAPNAGDGVAFHNYLGGVDAIGSLKKALESKGINKEFHFSETTAQIQDYLTPMFALGHWTSLFASIINNFGRSTITWNLVLDAFMGPRLGSSICITCIGNAQYRLGTLTNNPIGYANLHFAAISADLTGIVPGGTQAYRVPAVVSNDNGCFGPVVTIAAASGNGSGPKRVGAFINNNCPSTVVVTLTTGASTVTCETTVYRSGSKASKLTNSSSPVQIRWHRAFIALSSSPTRPQRRGSATSLRIFR